ncbi:MAG: DUF2927 domain-containing protein, partial [Siphonobacter aquaeclarae]|nr:DUF2927 domain-containing protein [Siphonobacter aquaeclarae]
MKYPWLPALLLVYPLYLFLASHWPLIPPTIPAQSIRKNFTQQQLQYFSETAFEGSKPLKRWTEDIRIQVIGHASQEEQQDVAAAIRELEALRLPVRISLVQSDENLPVSFLKKAEYEAQYKGDSPAPIGFVNYGKSDFNRILSARIFVRTDIEERLKKHVFRHELCHALGLPSHSPSYYPLPNFMGKQVMDIHSFD